MSVACFVPSRYRLLVPATALTRRRACAPRPSKGNLRELALQRLRALGLACRDVRTREAGIVGIHDRAVPHRVELVRRDYWANGGWETFLAYEDADQDILIGLLRLRRLARAPKAGGGEGGAVGAPAEGGSEGGGGARRRVVRAGGGFGVDGGSAGGAVPRGSAPQPPSASLRGRCSMVRELHVYGAAVGVGGRDEEAQQHRGYGALLMEEAERIAREEHRSNRMAVISGVGTRGYYRRLGYELCAEGSGYMLKELEPLADDRAAGWGALGL